MSARNGTTRGLGIACLAAFLAVCGPGSAEAARVPGKVVDREGKPAAGAIVWIAKLGYLEPLEAREAVADGSGAFAIEAGDGSWAVFARRGLEGGRASWESLAEIKAGKDPAPVTVRLGAPTNLKGRLFDAGTGEPIQGGVFALDDARRLEVDAQGRFEAPGLAMNNHEAYPVCAGYERKRILFDTTGEPEAMLELKVPKAGKVVGRVVDSGGKPIPGATVGLRTSGSIFSGSALWEKCSADGRFVYDGKPLGRAGRLAARAEGYTDLERGDIVVPDTSSPARVEFVLQADPRREKPKNVEPAPAETARHRNVSGTVIGPDGKPVTGAVVRWDLLVSSDSVPETKTDSEGKFHLKGVPASANVLSVMAKGLAPSFPVVEAGGDHEVKVELKAGATIRGRVVDDQGAPIQGAQLMPTIDNPKPNWGGFVYLDELLAKTEADGRFRLEGMPPGVKCDVIAENRSSARMHPLSASDESKNVVTLLGEGAIRGRVVDAFGNPVRNFRVQVGIPKGAKAGEPVGGYFAGYGGTGLSFTRDDGEFTITGLVAGNLHHLMAISDGSGSGEVDRVVAQQVDRLKPAKELTIELRRPHMLRVRVFQANGKLVPEARVTVIQSEVHGGFQWGYSDNSWDDSVTARVDDRGWADFRSLAFGKGFVVVRARGFGRMKLDWAKGEEELNVFLEPESKITGKVLDEAGKPVVGARIAMSLQGEFMDIPIGNNGSFVADGLRSGLYSLSVVSGAGPGLFSERIELKTGEALTKDIRVKVPKPAAR